VRGFKDGRFAPQAPATRAEVAVVLDRYIQKLAK